MHGSAGVVGVLQTISVFCNIVDFARNHCDPHWLRRLPWRRRSVAFRCASPNSVTIAACYVLTFANVRRPEWPTS